MRKMGGLRVQVFGEEGYEMFGCEVDHDLPSLISHTVVCEFSRYPILSNVAKSTHVTIASAAGPDYVRSSD